MATSYKQLIKSYTDSINNDKKLSLAEKQAKLNAIQNWARSAGVITTKRNSDGSETFQGWTKFADRDTDTANSTTKDLFTKATGLEWGTGKKTTTPEKTKEAQKAFVNSDPSKVTPEKIAQQENNITKYDNGTAAGQGRNTDAAKAAQEAQRDSRKLVNEVKKDGVADIPVTDATSDAWYEDGTADGGNTDAGAEKQIAGTNANPSDVKTPEEKAANGNGLLLADILMTGVKNALHYRPAFRTAYGEDIEGRDFGNERSMAMKLAEENMKRGLERQNARKDAAMKTEAQIADVKAKSSDQGYLSGANEMSKIGATITNSGSQSNSNPLFNTSSSYSTTNFAQPKAVNQQSN